jgi:capsular polysaccharide biosynthesis protein
VELPDLLTGIAAAQQADIFVGAHGANLANAWLMRPGSSVIELTMFQFDETDAHMNLAKRNLFVSGVGLWGGGAGWGGIAI